MAAFDSTSKLLNHIHQKKKKTHLIADEVQNNSSKKKKTIWDL